MALLASLDMLLVRAAGVDPSDSDSFEPDPLVFLWLCSPALTCSSCEPPRVEPDSFELDLLVLLLAGLCMLLR
jgi:hypothetical protein